MMFQSNITGVLGTRLLRLLLLLTAAAPSGLAMDLPPRSSPPPSSPPAGDLSLSQQRDETVIRRLATEAPTLKPNVLQHALDARSCARVRGDPAGMAAVMTIIDYALPSSAPRLFVVDADRGALLYLERVAHGKNSGEDLTTSFSNVVNSLESSLGLFRTAETYQGAHGLSLRLEGLEPGFNDRARERDIVIHGADYNCDAHVADFGRLGRSWGCPALPTGVSRPIINEIEGGTLLFSYYPDPTWLRSSTYLHCTP